MSSRARQRGANCPLCPKTGGGGGCETMHTFQGRPARGSGGPTKSSQISGTISVAQTMLPDQTLAAPLIYPAICRTWQRTRWCRSQKGGFSQVFKSPWIGLVGLLEFNVAFVTVTDKSRPCQPDKLFPLLPWPGFDPSFSGHNDELH